MNSSTTHAIILKRLSFSEADRILTAITPDKGKISLLAKGVRKSKSKLAGGLELFSVSNIGFINGRSELKTVISARIDQNFGEIIKDVELTMIAYEFLKLVDSHTKDSCEREYFDLLKNGLESLNEDTNSLLTKVWFETQMLSLAGRGINLDTQQDGSEFDEEKTYKFDYDDMGFFVHSSGEFSPNHIKFLRLLVKVTKPDNLLKVADAAQLADEIKPLLEHCIRLH